MGAACGHPPGLDAVSICPSRCTQAAAQSPPRGGAQYIFTEAPLPLLLCHSPHGVHVTALTLILAHSLSPAWTPAVAFQLGPPGLSSPLSGSSMTLGLPSFASCPTPTSMTSDCSYPLQGHGTGRSLCLKSSPHSHPVANSCSSWLLAQGIFA